MFKMIEFDFNLFFDFSKLLFFPSPPSIDPFPLVPILPPVESLLVTPPPPCKIIGSIFSSLLFPFWIVINFPIGFIGIFIVENDDFLINDSWLFSLFPRFSPSLLLNVPLIKLSTVSSIVVVTLYLSLIFLNKFNFL